MNLDFKVPLSGRIARKIEYASSIMKLDVDAAITKHLHDDMLTSDEVEANVGPSTMNAHRTQMGLSVVQYVADCNYRAMIGTETEEQNMEMLLLSALASGRKLLIVESFDFKHGTKTSQWAKFMQKMQIDFVDGSNAQDGIDLNAKIILASERSNLDYLRKTSRDRVFVYSHHIDQHLFSLHDLFNVGPDVSSYSLADMCLEFERVVLGFYTIIHSVRSQYAWFMSLGFTAMASALFGDNKMVKAISTERNSQKLLNDSGIMLTSPHHIAKMLNINVDILRATASVYDAWSDSLADGDGPAASQD